MDLSVVIPVYDEAENICQLLAEIETALDGVCDFEMIVVDDGSTDATPQRIADMQRASAGRVRLVRHTQNCGQSTAVLTGVRAARAPTVVTLDGDGQNDPADIPRLLAARAQHGPGEMVLIAGHRRKRRDNALRRLSSAVANGVRSRLLNDDSPDTGCGLKLFPREAFLALPHFDHMHRFLPALFLRHGGRVVSVEVRHRPRLRGRSKYGVFDRLWVGIVDILGVRWLQRRPCRAAATEREE